MRSGIWRIVWILVAITGMVLIYPWRSVDNAGEVAEAQLLVDDMSDAHDSIVSGASTVDEYAVAEDGFAGFVAVTPGDIAATGLIGMSGDDCVVMHWTAPDIAQVGRMTPDVACDPSEIEEVPLRPNSGYVPGTGPPFDVTPLIREAHTPVWFLGALVVLAWLFIKSGLDLFLIFLRPDYFFSRE